MPAGSTRATRPLVNIAKASDAQPTSIQRRTQAGSSRRLCYHITDELKKDHGFTVDFLEKKKALYVSVDQKMWWEQKTNSIYQFEDDNKVLCLAISQSMNRWSVIRAREEGESGELIGEGFESLEEAFEHGNIIYNEIKRMEIQDRIGEMLEVIKVPDDKINIVEIDNNFTERKTGGLLPKEIECLNEIWDRWKNN